MANKKTRTTDAQQTNVEIFSEDDPQVVTLTDSDNHEIDFYEVAVVEYESGFYALLQPVESLEGVEEDEVMIFKIEEGEGDADDSLTLLEDDDVIETVFNLYLKAEADRETAEDEGESDDESAEQNGAE